MDTIVDTLKDIPVVDAEEATVVPTVVEVADTDAEEVGFVQVGEDA